MLLVFLSGWKANTNTVNEHRGVASRSNVADLGKYPQLPAKRGPLLLVTNYLEPWFLS